MAKEVQHVSTIIDGINLNARHFSAMNETDAINAMIADGITQDRAWAKKAFNQMSDDVKKADAPKPATPATPATPSTPNVATSQVTDQPRDVKKS